VAAGTYQPSSSTYYNSTFKLPRGITLLGGYPDSGDPTDIQRNWINNPTILSDGQSSNTVITAIGIDTAVLFDGFIVENGYPGGMLIQNCSQLTIQHTIIKGNYEGALNIFKSNVVLSSCAIDNNSTVSADFIRTDSSDVALYNSIVADNSSNSSKIIHNSNGSIQIVNCDIVHNTGSAFFGTGSGSVTIRNSIFWNNPPASYALSDGDDFFGDQVPDITNSLTQTFYKDGVNTIFVNSDPRFYNIANPAGADGKFFTADDGLQLTAPCSPGLNTGDNGAIAGIATDVLGRPRIYNGGTVDLGPYEWQGDPGTPLKTVYVNNSASNTGANNGSSWQKAFKTLQQALLYCADTIKVAAGVYKTVNSLTDSVFNIESKTVILGGYAVDGNPTDASRDPDRYQTLLTSNFPSSYYDNNSTVLRAFRCDSTTIIDGLSFSNPLPGPYVGGIPTSLLISYGSNPRVTNCRFLSSSLSNITVSQHSNPLIRQAVFIGDHGVINCQSYSSPTIQSCHSDGTTGIQFNADNCTGKADSCIFNYAILNQSGIRFSNSLFNRLSNTGNSSNSFDYCIFKNNLYNSGLCISNDHSSPVFSRCLFDSSFLVMSNTNRAAPVLNNCVSINSQFMQNDKSFPILNNCTIVNTYPGVYINASPNEAELIDNSDSSVLTANNTIFWGSRLAPGIKDISNKTPGVDTALLTNCITRNYGPNGINGNKVGVDPRFLQLSNIYGQDGKMFTADDGLRLAKCSPGINGGNNTAGTILQIDILGNPRIVNTTVDIGAYESLQTADMSHSYYVNSSAGGNNTGTTWQNAYTELQSAVCNVCADTIRVAAGTYTPAKTNRDSTFFINRPLTLLGGYPATGSPDDTRRKPLDNATILSGNIGNTGDSADNSKKIITIIGVPDSVMIDGFVIRDGYRVSNGRIEINVVGGSGIYMYYNRTIIKNCQFIKNTAFPDGGAIAFGGRVSCDISQSIFTGNSAQNYGGAIASSGATLNLTNCVFDNNYAYGQGGALHLTSFFDVRNCLFYGNYTTAASESGKGGAADASQGSGTFRNCTLVGNRAGYKYPAGGGGIYTNQSLSTRVWNTIFRSNTSGGSSTRAGDDIDFAYNVIFNCVLQVNRPYITSTNIYKDPLFIDTLHPKGPDGKWMTADDGLQLTYYSPAVNLGDNTGIAGVSSDLIGDPRIVNNIVDAGAYEFQDRPLALTGLDTLICNGDSIQIGRGGDPAFSYSWTSDPTGFVSSDLMPFVKPTVPTRYYLQVSDGSDISKDSIDISVVNSLTPAISIATDTTAICQGTNVLFSATSLNGGDSAHLQWQINGIDVGTDSSFFASRTLADSSEVMAILTSSISCASPKTVASNAITMHVKPVVTPSFTFEDPGSVCLSKAVTLKIDPANGGDHPSYLWNTGHATYTTTVDSLNTYFIDSLTRVTVVMTSSDACAAPNTFTWGINIKLQLPTEVINPRIVGRTAAAHKAGRTLPEPALIAYLTRRRMEVRSGAY